MTTDHPAPDKSNPFLPLIGAFKLVKAIILFAASYALRYLRRTSDMRQTLEHWAHVIHFDPEGSRFRKLIEHATAVDLHKIHFAAIVLFVYACLFATEGTGLLLRKRWGEYVTVVVTSLLLPLEIYELFEAGHRIVKILILIANLAIIAYLIWNLYRTRERHAEPKPAEAAPASPTDAAFSSMPPP